MSSRVGHRRTQWFRDDQEDIGHERAERANHQHSAVLGTKCRPITACIPKGAPVRERADRYRRVAGQFTARARQVPEGRWDDPAPCEGWVARDVVRHLVDWMPGLFLAGPALPLPARRAGATRP